MKSSIVGGILDELETTAGSVIKQAGQAVKGIGSDAMGQVIGWEQIVGKPIDPIKYQQMQEKEKEKNQKNLAAIRRNLQQNLEPPPQKQPEPPKYIKAKVEKQEKMQKEFEEQKKKPSPLSVRSAQGMAGPETKGGWGVGG